MSVPTAAGRDVISTDDDEDDILGTPGEGSGAKEKVKETAVRAQCLTILL